MPVRSRHCCIDFSGATRSIIQRMMVAAAANLASFVAGGRLREAKSRWGSVLYILLNAALLCWLLWMAQIMPFVI